MILFAAHFFICLFIYIYSRHSVVGVAPGLPPFPSSFIIFGLGNTSQPVSDDYLKPMTRQISRNGKS